MRSNWRSVLATARQITSVRTAARAPAAAAAATTTTTTASAAFALGGVAVVAAAAAAGTALASAKEKVFEPGHAIGTGLRAELWKRKVRIDAALFVCRAANPPLPRSMRM